MDLKFGSFLKILENCYQANFTLVIYVGKKAKWIVGELLNTEAFSKYCFYISIVVIERQK